MKIRGVPFFGWGLCVTSLGKVSVGDDSPSPEIGTAWDCTKKN